MALISELNAVTADALTYPLPTVSMFSRHLREGGLLSKKGRGRGAAHATPLDGARLLIALLAARGPSQAVECVTDFGSLLQGQRTEPQRRISTPQAPDEFEPMGFTIDKFYALPRFHTFEEAIAAIIAGFAVRLPPPHLDVVVFDTGLSAKIIIMGNSYDYAFKSMINWQPEDGLAGADEFNIVAAKYRRGVHSRRQVEIDALRKIALVINGREEPGFPS